MFPDNYDQIINEIEKLVEENCNNIPEILSRKFTCNMRLLGDAFQFITGVTLVQYIRQRRLIHTVRYHLETGSPLEESCYHFGFPDAATMSKAFKRSYGVNPSSITKNDLRKYPPLKTEFLMSGKIMKADEDYLPINNTTPLTFFGVTDEQFTQIKQIMDFNAIYGLDEGSLKLVSYIFEHYQVDLDKAFSFVEDLNLQIENGDVYMLDDLPDLIGLCFKYDLSCSDAEVILSEIYHYGFKSLDEVPDGFFDIYFSQYNDGYNVHLILEIIDLLNDFEISTKDFDKTMKFSEYYNGDPIRSILEYNNDENDELAMIQYSMENPGQILEAEKEDPGIWELSEEQYYNQ